jgi:hypothetical protein
VAQCLTAVPVWCGLFRPNLLAQHLSQLPSSVDGVGGSTAVVGLFESLCGTPRFKIALLFQRSPAPQLFLSLPPFVQTYTGAGNHCHIPRWARSNVSFTFLCFCSLGCQPVAVPKFLTLHRARLGSQAALREVRQEDPQLQSKKPKYKIPNLTILPQC